MKSDHLKESKNIEDRRGQSGSAYSSGRSSGNIGGGDPPNPPLSRKFQEQDHYDFTVGSFEWGSWPEWHL